MEDLPDDVPAPQVGKESTGNVESVQLAGEVLPFQETDCGKDRGAKVVHNPAVKSVLGLVNAEVDGGVDGAVVAAIVQAELFQVKVLVFDVPGPVGKSLQSSADLGGVLGMVVCPLLILGIVRSLGSQLVPGKVDARQVFKVSRSSSMGRMIISISGMILVFNLLIILQSQYGLSATYLNPVV